MATRLAHHPQNTSKRITIREYLRNYKKYNDLINDTQENIIITTQDKDIVLISPIKQKQVWTFEDFKNMMVEGGDPNLSNNIDKIAYGI